MLKTETSNILNRHLFWISLGLTLNEILVEKDELSNNFSQTSTRDIDLKLIVKYQDIFPIEIPFEPLDLSRITFLYIQDEDFDGNLDFISECINITHIYLDGWIFQKKINTLQHLLKLHKLEYLNIANNEIISLEPLSELVNLKELWIYGNKIDSIQSIYKLKHLQELRCSYSSHKEVYNLIQKAKDCNVEYQILNEENTYYTTRVDKLFFKYIRNEHFEPPSEYVDISYCFDLFNEQANENLENSKIENELFAKTDNMVNEYIMSLNVTYQLVLEVLHSSSILQNNQYTFNYKLLILNEQN